ncbi:MAG: RNA methyltransferase [Gammaproteobacteria bacterium]|nr:RNA methyltransferase [Gammaproteobacteria bacterium]
MLDNVRIVLVETSHPGNIGASARAMKNMGLGRLYLVRPRLFPHAEASARASGADDVLANARLCDTLSEALGGCTLALASSARGRTLSWPQLSPNECAKKVMVEGPGRDVALVFGRERCGLSNSELDLCHALVHIPANPSYASLNLSAAVQILCYELYVASANNLTASSADGDPMAEIQRVEQFYIHLEQTLTALEFLDPSNPKYLMRRLRRLFNRVRLTGKEVNILRGILTATQRGISR